MPATKLFYRGDSRQPKGPDLAPGDLTVGMPEGKPFEIASKDATLSTTGRRLAWAKHLTDGTHPLFGRVMANRIWLNHFGRGIVDTPGEFGRLGQLPTHPELLDWLALELPRQGWSLKKFHKLIMTSTVYRQSSRREASKDALDGSNALYGRFPVWRLEAESVRDRILAAAGRLDRTQFGPPVPLIEDAAGQVGIPDDRPRRSIYLQIGRLPVCEGDLNDKVGRDHNGQGFTCWLAGGGIKGGITYGETDEFGHKAAVNVVTPNDFQATILHLLGMDHEKLVYHHGGKAQRLTDGRPARVVKEILA